MVVFVVGDLFTAKFIELASGDALKLLGFIVGVRDVLPDETLRTRIRVLIRLNRTRGEFVDIIDSMRLSVPGLAMRIFEIFPAGYSICVFDPISVETLEWFAELNLLAKSAGVKFRGVSGSTEAAGTRFTLSGVPPGISASTGFGSTIGGGGGTLVSVRV